MSRIWEQKKVWNPNFLFAPRMEISRKFLFWWGPTYGRTSEGIPWEFPHWCGWILKNSHVLVCETLVFRIRPHQWEDFQGILSPVRPYLESNRAWKSELQGSEIWDTRVRNLRYKKSEIQVRGHENLRSEGRKSGEIDERFGPFSAYNNGKKIVVGLPEPPGVNLWRFGGNLGNLCDAKLAKSAWNGSRIEITGWY